MANSFIESSKFWPNIIYTQIGQALLYQALSMRNLAAENPCSSKLYILYNQWCDQLLRNRVNLLEPR